MGMSIEQVPIVTPGIYPGLWSGYVVKIIFANGRQSKPIAVDEGIRGINCKCSVKIDEDGWLYVY